MGNCVTALWFERPRRLLTCLPFENDNHNTNDDHNKKENTNTNNTVISNNNKHVDYYHQSYYYRYHSPPISLKAADRVPMTNDSTPSPPTKSLPIKSP